VIVTLQPVAGRRGLALLQVVDDAPDGFADLRHAYTLYAPTEKRADPTKRGRWTLGEKLVLALCDDAEIVSTRGAILFTPEGRQPSRRPRDRGSSFLATIRFSRADIETTTRAVRRLIPPPDVRTTYNGGELPHRRPVRTFESTLPTEAAGADGVLRPTRRK